MFPALLYRLAHNTAATWRWFRGFFRGSVHGKARWMDRWEIGRFLSAKNTGLVFSAHHPLPRKLIQKPLPYRPDRQRQNHSLRHFLYSPLRRKRGHHRPQRGDLQEHVRSSRGSWLPNSGNPAVQLEKQPPLHIYPGGRRYELVLAPARVAATAEVPPSAGKPLESKGNIAIHPRRFTESRDAHRQAAALSDAECFARNIRLKAEYPLMKPKDLAHAANFGGLRFSEGGALTRFNEDCRAVALDAEAGEGVCKGGLTTPPGSVLPFSLHRSQGFNQPSTDLRSLTSDLRLFTDHLPFPVLELPASDLRPQIFYLRPFTSPSPRNRNLLKHLFKKLQKEPQHKMDPQKNLNSQSRHATDFFSFFRLIQMPMKITFF